MTTKKNPQRAQDVILEPTPTKQKLLRSTVLTNESAQANFKDYDPSFKDWDGGDPVGVHTTPELLRALEQDKSIELDARVLGLRKYADGKIRATTRAISKESFLGGFRQDLGRKLRVREDFFGGNGGFGNEGGFPVGHDFAPLLGGPFYKNLYYYIDYIRMHADAFFAYHNDPFAKAIVQITRDFVLGTGYEMQCDLKNPKGRAAMAAWKAFEEVNDIPLQIDQACEEISIYGEVMFWKLPNNQSKIVYRLGPGDSRPVGLIPRVRLIDPSNIVEIVTYPEDITRPLFYVWLQPTQWQIFTTATAPELAGTPTQPTAKFIYRQVPAAEMLHFKINSVSNEKRGRSDFFPVFNYLKRLRDAVQYSMISLEKVSAWSIDTTIEGDQTDIDSYIEDQKRLGTIPAPGSEFVHSAGIKRNYLGNQHAAAHSSDAFQWCLSCIAAGVGIPVSYFGTHLSGGTTKASALVATEPVAKKMEKRREVVKRMLRQLWKVAMDSAGLGDVECNVIFPEMISQDSTQKIQNLLLMEQARWIKPERAATMAAKEIGIDDYNYAKELAEVGPQLKQIPMPLADPASIDPPNSMDPNAKPAPGTNLGQGGALGAKPAADPSGLTPADRVSAKANDRSI